MRAEHSQIFLLAAEWAYTHRTAPAFVYIYPFTTAHRGTNLSISYIYETVCGINLQLACFYGHRVVFGVVFLLSTSYNYEKLAASNIGMRNAVKLQQVTISFPSSELSLTDEK